MDDLEDFFSAISIGKQKRKQQLDETVGNDVDEFLNTVVFGKKIIKQRKESLVGDSFESLFWSNLKEGKSIQTSKPKKKKRKKDTSVENDVCPMDGDAESDNSQSDSSDSGSSIEESLTNSPNLITEKSLGLLSEPSNIKHQNDPLTPLEQKFATFEDLNKHYNLFLSRIQQQLSTLGGGGETRLEFLDDVNRNSVKVNHKFLRYNSITNKWEGSYAGEGPLISSTTYVTSSSYSIIEHDYYIGVNYEGAVTITLPTNAIEGTTYIVKDELGQASKGTNRYITILPSGSDLIDGRDRAILAFDFGSLTFIWRGNSWRVV